MSPLVVIVGGGPAGCAAAITLVRAGLRVCVLERSTKCAPRRGELLSRRAIELFGRLGVARSLDAHKPPMLRTMLTIWGNETLRPSAAPLGCCIENYGLDDLFRNVVRVTGVEVERGAAVLSASMSHEDCRLHVLIRGRSYELRAAFVMDATGKSARVARSLGAVVKREDRLVALGRSGPRVADCCEALLESGHDGWWYAMPTSDGAVSVVHMCDADFGVRQNAMWNRRFAETSAGLQSRLAASSTSPWVRDASTQRTDPIVGSRWVAVGDAAYCTDPLSGGGITNALRAGIAGARAIVLHFAGSPDALATYAATLQNAWQRSLRARFEAYASETRFGNALFWSRRLTCQ